MKKIIIMLVLISLVVVAGCGRSGPKTKDTTSGKTGDTGTNGLGEDINSLGSLDSDLGTSDEITDEDLVITEDDL